MGAEEEAWGLKVIMTGEMLEAWENRKLLMAFN